MNPQTQFQLAETPLKPGTTLIEASAGTGKTYAITGLVVRLIVEHALTLPEILVVTYTEAATEELRDRVRQMLAKAAQAFAGGQSDVPFLNTLAAKYSAQAAEVHTRLQNALCGFDEAPIYTIHGFCQRTLSDRAFESGLLFDTELVTDPSEFVQEIADDFWRKHFYEADPTLVGFALKNGLGPEQFVALLKTCLNYPQIQFLSQASGRSLESVSGELQRRFAALKHVWSENEQAIRACFGSAIKWGNKPYNRDAEMAEHFARLVSCFAKSDTAFEAFESFEIFSQAALNKARAAKGKEPVPNHPFFKLCQELCETEQLWLAALQLSFVEFARQELPKRKAERKIQYFDDLLTRLCDALSGPGGELLGVSLRKRYRAALIDEFQDTDPVQYEIFRRAFADGTTLLFLIGDPKQAIYGFRGADIFTYLSAAGEASERFTLTENWRSEAGLVTAVNTVFSATPDPFVVKDIAFQGVTACGRAEQKPLTCGGKRQAPFQLWFYGRNGTKEIPKYRADEEVPQAVTGEIVRLLNGDAKLGGKKLQPEDIAVLVPENRHATLMQKALTSAGVPSVLHTTANLFESEEAKELYRVLAGIAAPMDERGVKAALATDLMGVDGCELVAGNEDEFDQERGGAGVRPYPEWLERFHVYAEEWDSRGFFRMFRHWLQAEQVRPRLLDFADGERRLTNLLHLGEVLHGAETAQRLGITGLLQWFARQRSSPEPLEEHELRLERDDNAVRLVTVHKSKGLEYPIVFCAFGWRASAPGRNRADEVFFHTPPPEQRLVRDLGPAIDQEHRQRAFEERLAENVRLLYVSLTRARHRCYFAWGAIYGADTAAAAWLLHRPPEPDATPAALAQHFKGLDDAALLAGLNRLTEGASSAIAVSSLPATGDQPYKPDTAPRNKLKCRQFKGRIQRDWVISSFTHLTAGFHQEFPDRDSAGASKPEDQSGTGIFGFPRGAKAGICLHELLERLDFEANDDAIGSLAKETLAAHGLAQESNTHAVRQMLRNLLHTGLVPEAPGLSLSKVRSKDRLNELEFYFPAEGMSPSRLRAMLQAEGWSPGSAQDDEPALEKIKGFLKGFIDLVFQHEGRFYLVDWKSNWLGNRVEDYAPARVREEMLRQQYYVQYHLYALALHKYLVQRLPNYDYQRDFGGAIYVFLRGVDPEHPRNGLFHAKPELNLLTAMAALLEGR